MQPGFANEQALILPLSKRQASVQDMPASCLGRLDRDKGLQGSRLHLVACALS